MEKIFEAALHNQTEVIKDYLKFGNVNLADSNKVSLLHYAAMGNSIEVANLLLDNYAKYTDEEKAQIKEVFEKVVELNKVLDKYDTDKKSYWEEYCLAVAQYFNTINISC